MITKRYHNLLISNLDLLNQILKKAFELIWFRAHKLQGELMALDFNLNNLFNGKVMHFNLLQ